MDQPMASYKSSSSSGEKAMDANVSVPPVSHSPHCDGHHHHRKHRHHRHHHELPVRVILGDLHYPHHHRHHEHRHGRQHHISGHHERKYVKKFLGRKHLGLHRAHRSKHMRKEKLYRSSLLCRCGARDPAGPSTSEAGADGDRHGFPILLSEDWQGMMDSLEAESMGCRYVNFRERGRYPTVGLAEMVAEALAESTSLQLVLSHRHGRKEKHHRHKHHRECPHRMHQRISAVPMDVCLEPETQRIHTPARVDVGGESPAAVLVTTQPRDDAGPSATYEEKLAEGLIIAP